MAKPNLTDNDSAHPDSARPDSSSQRGRTRPIGAAVDRVVRPVLGKRGLGEAHLVAHWSSIMGEAWADSTMPLKLRFPAGERLNGTLQIRVAGSIALEIQHAEPRILERINGFFGYAAVARLSLSQGPMPTRQRPKAARPPTPFETSQLEAKLAELPESELRSALFRLGLAVRRTSGA